MPDNNDQNARAALSRRQFLKGVGVVGAGSGLTAELLGQDAAEAAPQPLQNPPSGTTLKPGMMAVTLTVNGQAVTMEVETVKLTTGFFGGTGMNLARMTGPGRIGIQSMYVHHNTE